MLTPTMLNIRKRKEKSMSNDKPVNIKIGCLGGSLSMFLFALTLVFVVGKIWGPLQGWSWFFVFVPIWGPLAVIAAIMLICLGIVAVVFVVGIIIAIIDAAKHKG
jgi:hypothetical protein